MIGGERVTEKSIRWGMVGGGKGSNIGYIHRSAALRDNNFSLVAGAFDINPEKGKEFGLSLGVEADRCYSDYKTMFEEEAKRDDGIQAVSIATPNGTHYMISKAALETGLHVICEKPLCFTLEEAEDLENIAKDKGLIVGVTYGYTGHQMVQQARQMIANGDLGDIRLINTEFAYGFFASQVEDLYPAAKWRLDPKNAGPSFILGDVGTHSLHMAEAMIPGLEIENLLCAKQSFGEGRVLEDNANVMINFKGGIFCNLWASAINSGAHHGMKIRIIGSKASISWWAEHPNQLSYEVEGEPIRKLERGAGYLYDVAKDADRIGAGHPEGLFESWSNIYRRFAMAMEAADKGDQEFLKDFWYPNVHEGALGVKFVEKCIESADKGAVWVDFD